jgi:hypothetical protein
MECQARFFLSLKDLGRKSGYHTWNRKGDSAWELRFWQRLHLPFFSPQ